MIVKVLIRLRALANEDPETILDAINNYIDSWWNKSRPHWYVPYFSIHVQVSCGHLLEAVCLIPNYQSKTIDRIITLSERLLGSQAYYFLGSYIQILSLHPDYHGKAEQLIDQQLKAIKVPDYSASDAVTALLGLYPAALEINSDLASQIFIQSRIKAGGWDNRLDGTAYALLATLQNAQPISAMTIEQINELVAVFQVIQKVTDGYERTIHLDWLIRQLTNIDPHYSFAALFNFDQSDFMSFQESIEGLPAETVSPLTHILDTTEQVIPIYQRGVLLAQGRSRNTILNAYANYVQKGTERHRRDYYARQLVDWANERDLPKNQTIKNIDSLATQLEAFKNIQKTRDVDIQNYYHKGEELFTQFETEFTNSPYLGLQVLLEASNSNLYTMGFTLLSKAIRQLVEHLPSSKIEDILLVVERFNEKAYDPEAFSLLVIVAENNLSSQKNHAAYIQCLGRMLRPAQLDNLTRWHFREHLDALLSCNALDKQDVLNEFLKATSNSLSSLYANELYRLVGALSRLLDPQHSFNIYKFLHVQAVAKLPSDYSFSITPYQTEELYPLYIQFLADSLGHPDQRLCWSVLYALVDICINRPNPSINLLIKELDDKNHSRWMTKRVWLLILFHHLVLRVPSELKPFHLTFSDIALDKAFPHAKMRYHAKQIVISLTAIYPNLIEKPIMADIAHINQPQHTLTKNDSSLIQNEEELDESWRFDWDTTKDWYKEIEQCFGGERPTVTSAARNWILNQIGIVAEDAEQQVDWVRKKYGYDDTNNRNGDLPSVESLKLYAELHARYLVAGEFVDLYPVYETQWEEFKHYDVRGLDPILPMRLAQPLPTILANYDAFDKPFEEWVQKNDEQEFITELWDDTLKEELIVSAYFGADSDERDWNVNIDSYFVSPESSASLARLINSQADFFPLPHCNYSIHDISLTDLANKLLDWDDDNPFFHNEIDNGIFKLFGWTYYWSQSLPQHNLDPTQEGSGLGIGVLAPPFLIQNNIHFKPLSLEWHQDDGSKIGYSKFWSDREGKGRYEKFTSGYKLIIHQDFLQAYLHQNGLELLVTVRLTRSRPYSDRYKEERRYDHGTTRAFIINAKNEVTLHMDNHLIEKGQKLIEELSLEQASTLQQWMIHHIAELMHDSEFEETQDERQAASEKCAHIISQLWAVQAEKEATDLQQTLWQAIRLPDDELELEILADALNNLPKNKDLTPKEHSKLFQLVTEVEGWVWRISALSVTPDDNTTDSSVENFLRRENAPDLVAQLAQVFPELTDQDITDKEGTQIHVTNAMRKLYRLRHSLVWEENTSQE